MNMQQDASLYFSFRELQQFCSSVFMRYGLTEPDACIVADNLVTANLRGVESHGVSRMGIYTQRLSRGLFNAKASPKVNRTGLSTATVDGDNAMGAVLGVKAMGLACEMAQETGIGAVAVHDSNHYGASAYFLKKPISLGFVGVNCNNAPPTTAPFGGAEPILGTNPFAVGVPTEKYPAIIVDMATSITARGKIILAEQQSQPIAPGLAIDAQGRPTTDPKAALLGAMLPFGGHKGSALAVLVEVFAGALSGGNMLKQIPDLYRELTSCTNLGQFFVSVDVGRFLAISQFKQRIDLMITMLKASRPAEGATGVMMPGEIEAALEAERIKTGVPLSNATREILSQVAKKSGVLMPTGSSQTLA